MRPVAFFDPRSRAPPAPGPLAQQRTNGPPKRPAQRALLGQFWPAHWPVAPGRRMKSDGRPGFSADPKPATTGSVTLAAHFFPLLRFFRPRLRSGGPMAGRRGSGGAAAGPLAGERAHPSGSALPRVISAVGPNEQ